MVGCFGTVFDALKIPVGGYDGRNFWADELYTSTRDSDAVQGELTGRHHLAFQAHDRAMVDAFHKAALAHGGTDNGAPGERPYHTGYYAAFVLDPDGNNIEALFRQRLCYIIQPTFRRHWHPAACLAAYSSGVGSGSDIALARTTARAGRPSSFRRRSTCDGSSSA